MKKLVVALIALLLVGQFVFANGQQETAEKASGPVTIVMWHSMSGKMGEALKTLADNYNATKTDYQIELQYQGSYSDALTKYKSTAKADLPDLFMCQAESTGYMIGSGTAYPIQNFIDRDKFDISILEPDLINYYTVDGKLMNLGFGRSIVGIIYNVDALAAAGYSDPYAQLKTWDDVLVASGKIVDKGLCEYGVALWPSGWPFEFFAGVAGKEIVDSGNGRNGKVTKSIIDENGLGVEWFSFIRKFQQAKGTLTEYTAGGDYLTALGSGQLAMLQVTSSNISTIAAAADGKFKVGFLPYPAPSKDSKGGLSVGGNSTWIIDTGKTAKMEGAWDWVKFCLEFDNVLQWSKDTGYAAITTEVCDSQEYHDVYANICPTIFDGIDALRKCPAQYEGAFMPIFDKHRNLMWTEIQRILNDSAYTPEQATANFVSAINQEFELYNATN